MSAKDDGLPKTIDQIIKNIRQFNDTTTSTLSKRSLFKDMSNKYPEILTELFKDESLDQTDVIRIFTEVNKISSHFEGVKKILVDKLKEIGEMVDDRKQKAMKLTAPSLVRKVRTPSPETAPFSTRAESQATVPSLVREVKTPSSATIPSPTKKQKQEREEIPRRKYREEIIRDLATQEE